MYQNFVVNKDLVKMETFFLFFRFIKKVGLNLEIPGGTRIIDATGKLVIPGEH